MIVLATENWKGVKVRYQLLTKGTRRYGEKLDGGKPQFIVAHDTGNINTSAQTNVNYYENTYNIPWNQVASAHIFVDDKEAIICIPTTEKAWHVLYDAPTDNLWYNKDANDVAIGVEICYFSDRERSRKALDNGARVLAYLSEYWNIDYTDHMPGHQDIQVGKIDPGNALEASGYGRATKNLDKLVAKYYKKKVEVKPTPTKPKKGATSLTRNEFVKWLKTTEGKQYDYDLYAAFQCFDYANIGWDKLFGHGLKGEGAKDIPFNSYNVEKFKTEATVYKNTPSFLAKPGDLVVWGAQLGGGYGHVAWVIEATLNHITVIEQNWLNGGWTAGPINNGTGWETATRRQHNYETQMWFIRPKFSQKSSTKKVSLFSTKPKKKQPKITWNWKGRFTSNTTIKVRRSPGLTGSVVPQSDWIKANQWVDFVSVTKKDGYWWIKFKYPTNPSAGYFYCAVCKITDTQARIKKEKYWGKIDWK